MFIRPLILRSPDAPASAAPPPTPAPAPAPTPAPSPAPAPSGGDATENPFAELDAKFKAAGEPGAQPAPVAPKPAEAKPAETPPPKPPAADVQRTPKELRAELDRVRGEAKTASEAKAALETKIKEYDAKGKDTEALMARLAARDKEFDALQGELRALKQEASPEFKKQYDEPFNRAARFAERMVGGMTKIDGTQAAFDKDFVPLYRLPYNAAYSQAREVFGDEAAPAVMEQVRELQRLDFQRQEAFEEEKKGWEGKQREADGLKVQQTQEAKDVYNRVNTDLQNSVAEYRDPPEDKEASELRQQGYAIVDATPKDGRQAILKFAHMRQRVAAFGPNQLQIKRLTAKLASLEKQLADTKPRPPAPGGTRPTGGEKPGEQKDWEAGLREAVTG